MTLGSAAAGLIVLLGGCGSSGPTAPGAAPSATHTPGTGGPAPAASQAPVPAESNPPGDIPDTTVYVPYQSAAGHFQLRVPEGWSRSSNPSSATFSSNLNSITAAWMPMAAAPSVSAARATTVPALRASTLAFRLQAVRAVPLAGGTAIEIVYQVNSQPNAVTGRQYRLVIERFELQRAGRLAVVSLSSAVGSDNVDPWRIVSESFRWM
ncbi:MAG TPA: hypothetical protein VH307_15705 [Streptosporangiaceae bacterium]|nr:hypothetical protein [Streptosporangiaceae bacterium]